MPKTAKKPGAVKAAARQTKADAGKTARNGKPGSKIPSAQKPDVFTPAASDPVTFTHEGWTDFRNPSRITVMAGVTWEHLPEVAVKELVDNALDASPDVEYGVIEKSPGLIRFFVKNGGPGIPGNDEEIARRFSVRRAAVSSKTLRLPTRGALGNGIRVVMGVVLISGGELKVSTNGRTLTLVPDPKDGSTKVVKSVKWNGTGTMIQVTLRGELADHADEDTGLFTWADEARALAVGPSYKGTSSPWWYSAGAFWELLQAAGDQPVERVIQKLDGCSARDKTAAVAGELAGRPCATVTRDEAEDLLGRAQGEARTVSLSRLGKVGKREDEYRGYANGDGVFYKDQAAIPYVVEVWADRQEEEEDEPALTMCVNRTPIVTDVKVWRQKKGVYAISGAGLHHVFPAGRESDGDFRLVVNVISPFVPLKSSGKDPDLKPMHKPILKACALAIKRVKRKAPARPGGKAESQKAFLFRRVPEKAAELLAQGKVVTQRGMLYLLRGELQELLGRDPKWNTFTRIVGQYEDEHGDIENLIRDDRGYFYHPHTGDKMPLGTRSVAGYQRPEWLFSRVIFIEKATDVPLILDSKILNRFDCALATCQGFNTRAVRDLLKHLKLTGEPVIVGVAHDSDGQGTCIYETLKNQLEPHGVDVVDLGLNPEEARSLGLQDEKVKKKGDGRVPVGSHIPPEDREWLQTRRIELNALTTDFIPWLEEKMTECFGDAKVIPPEEYVVDRFHDDASAELKRLITDEVLLAAKVGERVARLMDENVDRLGELAEEASEVLEGELAEDREKHWGDITKDRAAEIAKTIYGGEEPAPPDTKEPEEPPPTFAELQAAKRIGFSILKARRGRRILDAIENAKAAGDPERAERLRQAMNRSIGAAYNMLLPSEKRVENDGLESCCDDDENG